MDLASVIALARQNSPSGDWLPAELVEASRTAGLYRLCLSTELGGTGTSLPDTLSAITTLAYEDGSLGWCTAVANAGAGLLAGVEEAEARKIAADPDGLLIAGGYAPIGRCVRNGDSYEVTGQWSFASGCTAATWILAGVMVDSRPLVTFLPVEEATIVPNWDVIGLKATGSHDIAVDRAIVPVGRTTSVFGGPRWATDPIARIPFFGTASLLATVPLGCAERALDELVSLASNKESFANDAVFQVGFATATARLTAARSLLFQRAEDIWQEATTGPVSPPAVGAALLAVSAVAEASLAAVEFAHRAVGTAAIRDGHVLTRCLLDTMAATRHVMFHQAHRQSGRALLGLPAA